MTPLQNPTEDILKSVVLMDPWCLQCQKQNIWRDIEIEFKDTKIVLIGGNRLAEDRLIYFLCGVAHKCRRMLAQLSQPDPGLTYEELVNLANELNTCSRASPKIAFKTVKTMQKQWIMVRSGEAIPVYRVDRASGKRELLDSDSASSYLQTVFCTKLGNASAGAGYVYIPARMVHPCPHDSGVRMLPAGAPLSIPRRSKVETDVFLSYPMAAFGDDTRYRQERAFAMRLARMLRSACGFQKIFYAGQHLRSVGDFEPEDISLRDNLKQIRQSSLFVMIYPCKLVSSVLVEAGMALALDIPSVYFVRDKNHLPFLLRDTAQASNSARIYIYKDESDLLALIEKNGAKLFTHGVGKPTQ